MDNNTISCRTLKPAIDAIRVNFAAMSELKNKGSNTSMTELVQMYLMDALGYTQLQAQEVIDELKTGLKRYEFQRQALEDDPSALPNSIKNSLAAYSAQERINILTNILTALQLGESTNSDKDVESLCQANASLSEDELIQAVINALDGLPFASVVETVGKTLDNDTLASLEDMRKMMTEEYKLAAAIQLYIAQQQGKLNFGKDGAQLPPETIGAMTGASIDAINATYDLHNNHIDLKKWQRILKYILGSLFVVALCVLSVVAIISLNLGLYYIILSIFGIGMLSTILSTIAMIAFCFKACQWHDEAFDNAVRKMSGVYDKVIRKLTEWTNILRAKIAAFTRKNKQHAPAETQSEDKEQANCGTNGQSTDLVDGGLAAPALA